jgi:hypothetical protein
MNKYLWIFLALMLIGCGTNFSLVNNEDITNMYSSYVEEWKDQTKIAFDTAEKEVFKKPVTPKPDDGTNPDPAKCICNGTGIIVQGDGHKTVCPYHGKSSSKR